MMKMIKLDSGKSVLSPSNEGWFSCEDLELSARHHEFMVGECDLLEAMDAVEEPFSDY